MDRDVHVDRARRAYQAFRLLREQKLSEDAFSRGYYALLHLGFALLIRHGQDLPKTHSGLVAKLWASKEALSLPQELVKKISRFQALQESGDYAAVPAIAAGDLAEIEKTILSFFKTLGEKP